MSARIRSASLVGSEATAIEKACGDCGKVLSQSRTIEEEQRGVGVKFADIVVFVEGARLNLSTLIARYKLYKLER